MKPHCNTSRRDLMPIMAQSFSVLSRPTVASAPRLRCSCCCLAIFRSPSTSGLLGLATTFVGIFLKPRPFSAVICVACAGAELRKDFRADRSIENREWGGLIRCLSNRGLQQLASGVFRFVSSSLRCLFRARCPTQYSFHFQAPLLPRSTKTNRVCAHSGFLVRFTAPDKYLLNTLESPGNSAMCGP